MKKTSKVAPLNVSEDEEELDDPNIKDDFNPFRILGNIRLATEKLKKYNCIKRSHNNDDSLGLCEEMDDTVHLDKTLDSTDSRLQDATSQALIHHFCRAAKGSVGLDFDFIRELVAKGANINVRDKFGQSLLHEVARQWSVDTGKFLIDELKCKVSARDKYGRTPLHVAAATDYSEMCVFLIERGADREAETFTENQTPLFYAAKNDACNSLSFLVKAGCKFDDVRDYKERTPLFVAAELDRSETAKNLLDMGARADALDSCGQPVLVPLITKMPGVALVALHQFHETDRASRKQYYYLRRLAGATKDLEDFEKKPFPSPLDLMVTLHHHELITEPPTRRLLDVMWSSFARLRIIGQFIFQLVYVLSWTIFAVYGDWYERNNYSNPWKDHVGRLIVLIISVACSIYQIVDEILEYRHANQFYMKYKEWRTTEIEKDEQFCHPRWPNEQNYYTKEKESLKESKSSYFEDTWNIFDWFSYLLQLVSLILHFVHIGTSLLTVARWHIRFMAITIIFLWLRLMKVLRAFELLGPFIVILGKMLPAFLKFIFIYLEFYIPFTIAFWMLFGGQNVLESAIQWNTTKVQPQDLTTISDYAEVYGLMYGMFRITVVDDYPYSDMILVDHVTAQLALGSWLAISGIVLVNLFIAIMSDAFQRVYDNSVANALMEKATAILSVQEGLYDSKRRSFHQFLVEKCDPDECPYDDDAVTNEDDLQRATLSIRTTVMKMKEKMDLLFGTSDHDDEISPLDPDNAGKQLEEVEETPLMIGTLRQNLKRDFNKMATTQVMQQFEVIKSGIQTNTKRQQKMHKEMETIRRLLQDLSTVVTAGSFQSRHSSLPVSTDHIIIDNTGDSSTT